MSVNNSDWLSFYGFSFAIISAREKRSSLLLSQFTVNVSGSSGSGFYLFRCCHCLSINALCEKSITSIAPWDADCSQELRRIESVLVPSSFNNIYIKKKKISCKMQKVEISCQQGSPFYVALWMSICFVNMLFKSITVSSVELSLFTNAHSLIKRFFRGIILCVCMFHPCLTKQVQL